MIRRKGHIHYNEIQIWNLDFDNISRGNMTTFVEEIKKFQICTMSNYCQLSNQTGNFSILPNYKNSLTYKKKIDVFKICI